MSNYTTHTSTPGLTETDATAALAAVGQEPTELEPHKQYAWVVPQGYSVEQIDTETDGVIPFRKRGSVSLFDAESFSSYVSKHEEGTATELYADPTTPSVVAVLNGHANDIGIAGWGDHRANLVFRQTDAWKRWMTRNGLIGGQVDFAEHIEQSLPDIVEPSGADMLEMAQSFQAKTKVNFESGKDLASGQRQLVYHEEVAASAGLKGDITIPRRFTIGLIPYEGSTRYRIDALLRYRITDGRLAIGYVLDRPEDVLRAAFDDVLKGVQDTTGRMALIGVAPSAGQ